ncbi:MAG: MoaA/NifB/PqqE/SkfB family radical SAM enzyme [Polyangiales bacterium]
MEPSKQVEIQLGHMCNNRCVFCVSGQRTAMGEAKPMPAAPVVERLRESYADGHRKLTLLGGEPTLQPEFMTVVREAVALGFEEIVIFTNGVKTARAEVIDEVLATGGNFAWRISIQGATCEAHENTTKKRGSFKRILRTLENLQARGQHITVNMCVVTSNLESVSHFAELLLPYGVKQLHLDMMRPLDAGQRTKDEVRDMMPKLSDYTAPMTAMVRAFDERSPGFDVNVGNLPYCVAPTLLHRIHHDGERTDTIAIDGDDQLSQPWNKYFVKRRDKTKAPACDECVMHDACSGVFETYAEMHGLGELAPIRPRDLVRLDPERRMLARHLRPLTTALRKSSTSAIKVRTHEVGERSVRVVLTSTDGELRIRLGDEGPARYGVCRAEVTGGEGSTEDQNALLVHFHAHFASPPIAPLGAESLGTALPRSVVARLEKLRRAAPFGPLVWSGTRRHKRGVALMLGDGEQRGVELWLDDDEGRPLGGYTLCGEASENLRVGLVAALDAMRREY